MGKLNTNTFKSIEDYLSITRNSNIINTWLLGINFAILLFVVNNFIKPYGIIEILLKENVFFKILSLVLFIWFMINVSILIIFSYREKILSLEIEDKYYRLKFFMSNMDNVKDISEDELLNMNLYKIVELATDNKSKVVLNEYVDKIMKPYKAIVKWSNRRLLIYKFVILAAIPLLTAAAILVFIQVL